jgi:hypothetical protein
MKTMTLRVDRAERLNASRERVCVPGCRLRKTGKPMDGRFDIHRVKSAGKAYRSGVSAYGFVCVILPAARRAAPAHASLLFSGASE